ncbi:MAG TPA: endolytic transglycosylase MltG [Polyangiaceae bacterium]|nr:endolytic transglycosylase MltG [Polyangiaceae bacterium]
MGAKKRRRKRSEYPGARRSLALGYWLLGLLVAAGVAGVALLLAWSKSIGEAPDPQTLKIDSSWGRREIATYLHQRGLVDDERLFLAYWTVRHPRWQVESGLHIVPPFLAPADLLVLLARMGHRPAVSVNIPEGWSSFQIAKRLHSLAVCDETELLRLAHSAEFAPKLGVTADSLEGYLFPDTYELFVDSSAQSVLTRMVEQSRQRHQQLQTEHAARIADLQQRFGFAWHQIVTMASVVEKEAASHNEQPVVASVFFNRLSDATFRPAKMLQSDATAGYGCLRLPQLGSCQGFLGRITPSMLRDDQNPYNSYRHAGLPPGPIGNPGQGALRAVLQPADTSYLFFVAKDSGGHAFSRTLAEHEAAIAGGQ